MFSERLSMGILAVVLIAMAGTLIVLVWQRSTQPVLTDYEGTIVDRWAKYAESEQGSRPRFFLVVDDAQGRRFTVSVDPDTYESAKVGMRLKRESGKIVLIDPDKTP